MVKNNKAFSPKIRDLLTLPRGHSRGSSKVARRLKIICATFLSVTALMSSDVLGTHFTGKSHGATMAMAATASAEKSCEESGFSTFMKKLGLQGNTVSKGDLPAPLNLILSKEQAAHKETLESNSHYKQVKSDLVYYLFLAGKSFQDLDYPLSLHYLGKARQETDELPPSYYFYYAFITYRISGHGDYLHSRDQLREAAKRYADTYLALAGECADFSNEALKISEGKVL
jgi:hypothetical protein